MGLLVAIQPNVVTLARPNDLARGFGADGWMRGGLRINAVAVCRDGCG